MKEKRRRRFSGLWIVLLLVIAALVIGTMVTRNPGKQRTSGKEMPKIVALPSLVPLPQHSVQEMHEFWDQHVNAIVMDQLVGGKYPIPAINDRYKVLLQKTISMYGRPFNIGASTSYNKDSRLVVAGTDTDGPTPIIRLFVPAVMDVYADIQKSLSQTWRKQFEVLMVTSILHEADHIIEGRPGIRSLNKEEVIDREMSAWANTCENALLIFVNLGYPLDPSNQFFYEGWVACGRANNACWRSFVGSRYTPVLENYQ